MRKHSIPRSTSYGFPLRLFIIPAIVCIVLIGAWTFLHTAKKSSSSQTRSKIQKNIPFLGIQYEMKAQIDSDEVIQSRGARVMTVMQDSPAEKAGLSYGDTITKVDATVLDPTNKNQLDTILKSKNANQTISVTYDRYSCDLDKSTQTSACAAYKKDTKTTNITLTRQKQAQDFTYLSIFKKIVDSTPTLSWSEPYPDDKGFTNAGLGITQQKGFLINAHKTFADESADVFNSLISENELAADNWYRDVDYEAESTTSGVMQKTYYRGEFGKQQMLKYWVADQQAQKVAIDSEQKRQCPCTVDYAVFVSFPYTPPLTENELWKTFYSPTKNFSIAYPSEYSLENRMDYHYILPEGIVLEHNDTTGPTPTLETVKIKRLFINIEDSRTTTTYSCTSTRHCKLGTPQPGYKSPKISDVSFIIDGIPVAGVRSQTERPSGMVDVYYNALFFKKYGVKYNITLQLFGYDARERQKIENEIALILSSIRISK